MSKRDYRLFIYGAGGHAKVIADIAEQLGEPLTAAIDKNLLRKELLDQYPVYLNLDSIELFDTDQFIVAVGNNAYRKRIVEEELIGKQFATLIHTSVQISSYADVEVGTVVMPGAVINVDTQIGRHCIINTGATIDHDCVIEDYVHISPNASLAGNVLVGTGSHIGIGAVVIQGINIGKDCIIGAGSVIIRDVPSGCTVVGNPGRVINLK